MTTLNSSPTTHVSWTDIKTVSIYTDGSCIQNPGGKGGWGVMVELLSTLPVIHLHGAEASTTNNRMEMTAVINALQWVHSNCPSGIMVLMHLDSQYVLNGTTCWIEGWKKKNWTGWKKKPVLNKDLWVQIDQLHNACKEKGITFKWKWVKSHNGNAGNEEADYLAKLGYSEENS